MNLRTSRVVVSLVLLSMFSMMMQLQGQSQLTMLGPGVPGVSGHVCLLYPEQRGGLFGLEKPGSSPCIRVTGPCGGIPVGPPSAKFKRGTFANVRFQKVKYI
jgi:hypothetical protein